MTHNRPPLPAPGAILHGFTVLKVTPVPALRGTAIELEHPASGARVLHLLNEDVENLFSVSVPTPPPDDTGLPHILEHAVLAGSRRFPVREPFFEMLKASMATFINAMTGPDCTYYPVASSVKKDLFNLAEVYFDAVFHPLLTEDTFRREGHHLAPVRPDIPTAGLTVNGIVFNEMKGVYSNPEERLFYAWIKRLLPDTPYALNYAGDPDCIPTLTYERFKRFYETHYHPSNALFFLYGDIPTADHLAFLGPRLDPFTRRPRPAGHPPQSRWTVPRVGHDTYAIAPDEPSDHRAFLSLTWLTGTALDPEAAVLRHVLTNVLFGNEAAPLKKALIDSKLGEDLLHGGDMELGVETVFAVGLKGSEASHADAFTALVLDTLRDLATKGLDPEAIEAAFRQTSYHYLEITPMFPLHAMDRVLGAWAHGADPLLFLAMDRHLATCQARYQADPGLFARLIREQLLDNPHRLLTILAPDPDRQARDDAAFATRMDAERRRHSDAELRALAAKAAAVEAEAGAPNPPEAIALLPQLGVRDLPPRPRHTPTLAGTTPEGIPLLRPELFSNGVNYLHLEFDCADLPDEDWSFVPLYSDAIGKMGTAGMTYEQVARRVAAHTGGIGCWPVLSRHATDPARRVRGLRFTCKALDPQVPGALDILHDLLFGVDPRDRARLRDTLIQARAGYRGDVLESGQAYAQRHAARHLTPEGFLDELCHGIPQVALTVDACDHFEDRAEALMRRIERLRDFILDPHRMAVSFTGSDAAFGAVRRRLSEWAKAMGKPASRPGMDPAPAQPPATGGRAARPREGLAVPVQVAHCAQVMPAPRMGDPRCAPLLVGSHLVRFEYLLSEIRLKGNAYGAGISHSPVGGTLMLSSFRDPHIARTLGVFAKTADYVRGAGWTQADVDRAIIGGAKHDEKPPRPGEATGEVLSRYRAGITPEVRDAFYAERLAVTPRAARAALLETLDAGLATGPVCVLSSRAKLEAANATLGPDALAIAEVVV